MEDSHDDQQDTACLQPHMMTRGCDVSCAEQYHGHFHGDALAKPWDSQAIWSKESVSITGAKAALGKKHHMPESPKESCPGLHGP